MNLLLTITQKFLIAGILLLAVSCNDFIGEIKGGSGFGVSLKTDVMVSDVTITEGATTALLLSFSSPVSQSFTLRWTISGPGAGTDFSVTTGTVNVAQGAISVSQMIASNANLVSDGTRSYTLTFESVDGSVMNQKDVLFTINDDDPTSVPHVSIANVTVTEGNGSGTVPATFTVTLDSLSGSNTVIDYSTSNGSATVANNDYVSASGTLTIPAGSLTGTFSVDVNEDTLHENNETFTVTLSGGSGYLASGSTLSATGTITNDDVAPTVSLSAPTVAEGNGAGFTNIVYDVTLSQLSGVNTVVNFATANGTATLADSDYVTATGTLTIPSGSLTGQISISIIRDAKFETNETINLGLSGGSGYTAAGSTLTATGTITNDDTAPTISIANVSIAEGTGAGNKNMTFTITQSSMSGVATTVNYATSAGTATAATDYLTTGATATIAVGATTTTFTVPVVQDALDEDDETFTMTLSGGTNYTTLGSTLTATGTITDDDLPPTISIANVSAAEGSNFSFTVSLSAASGKTVTYDFATSDGTATNIDYTPRSLTGQTIAPGSTSATVTVNINDDSVNCETTETIGASISNIVNATAGTLSATGTLLENDVPVFTPTDATITEGGTASLSISSSITCPSNIVFNYATRSNLAVIGKDFSYQENTLTLAAGTTVTPTVNITTSDDSLSETIETFFVRYNGNTVGVFSKPASVITITDNESSVATAKIKTGPAHACAVSSEGNVKCWGNGIYGGLGYGDFDIGGTPGEMGTNLKNVPLGTGLEPVKVAVADEHTCALLSDGSPNKKLKCWGDNTYGILGQGHQNFIGMSSSDFGDNLLAINLSSSAHPVDMCAGNYQNCALLDNGDVKCWGYGYHGSLGNGIDNSNRGDNGGEMGDALPKVDFGPGITATKLGCYSLGACAVTSDKKVRCWGRNAPILGTETTSSIGASGSIAAINLGSTISDVLDLAVGSAHACAILLDSSDGRKKIKCWGAAGDGRLGLENLTNKGQAIGDMGDNLPYLDFGSFTEDAIKVYAGGLHTCAQFSSGKIKCWGQSNDNGFSAADRGISSGQMAALPDISFGAGLTVQSLHLSYGNTCAVVVDGSSNKSFRCIGSNNMIMGQDSSTPTAFLAPTSASVDFGSGTILSGSVSNGMADHHCAIVDTGTTDVLRCWGDNKLGQLGRGDFLVGDSLAEMTSLPNINLGVDGSSNPYKAIDVHLGMNYTCVLTSTGVLKCFGANDGGQLGISSTANWGDATGETVASLPGINVGAGRTVLAIGGAVNMMCALLDDFTLKCWGNSSVGTLGLEVAATLTAPPVTPINLGTNRFAIGLNSSGYNTHLCAVLDNDQIKCWGDNAQGSLGIGAISTTERGDDPGEMGDNLPYVDLGVDGSSNPHVPILVSAGYRFSCALLKSGLTKCWGYNNYGQLGINSTVSTGTDVTASVASTTTINFPMSLQSLSAGYTSNCGIFSNGTLKCWGYGLPGSLGQGSTTNWGMNNAAAATQNLPAINLGSGITALDVSTSGSSNVAFTCALLSNQQIKCWGTNSVAQLGLGDLVNRGAVGTETPDQLPAVPISW